MSKRAVLKKALTDGKQIIEAQKAQLTQKQLRQEKVGNEIQNLIHSNMKGKEMNLSKKLKSDLASLQILAEAHSKFKKTSIEKELASLLQEYGVETKATELTTDHTALMNNINSSDLQVSFDQMAADAALLSRFQRQDMAGKQTVTIPYDLQDVELQSLGEIEEVTEQTWNEGTYSITTKRVAMNFKLSRSLQLKSVVEQIAYLNRQTSIVVAKGMVKGILNGKSGSSADNGIPSKDIRNHMAGIRTSLKDASLTHDFSAAALDYDKMMAFFKAAGPKFRQQSSQFILLAGTREVYALSEIQKGVGVTGVNPASGSVIASKSFLGVEVIEVENFLNVTVSGSGYGEAGLVKSETTHNDHGILVLINPKAVWYAYESERVDVEFEPKTDSYSFTLNAQAGWTIINTEKDKNGLYGVNIGANIGSDA